MQKAKAKVSAPLMFVLVSPGWIHVQGSSSLFTERLWRWGHQESDLVQRSSITSTSNQGKCAKSTTVFVYEFGNVLLKIGVREKMPDGLASSPATPSHSPNLAKTAVVYYFWFCIRENYSYLQKNLNFINSIRRFETLLVLFLKNSNVTKQKNFIYWKCHLFLSIKNVAVNLFHIIFIHM